MLGGGSRSCWSSCWSFLFTLAEMLHTSGSGSSELYASLRCLCLFIAVISLPRSVSYRLPGPSLDPILVACRPDGRLSVSRPEMKNASDEFE